MKKNKYNYSENPFLIIIFIIGIISGMIEVLIERRFDR